MARVTRGGGEPGDVTVSRNASVESHSHRARLLHRILDPQSHLVHRSRLESIQLAVADGGAGREGHPAPTRKALEAIARDHLAPGNVLAKRGDPRPVQQATTGPP